MAACSVSPPRRDDPRGRGGRRRPATAAIAAIAAALALVGLAVGAPVVVAQESVTTAPSLPPGGPLGLSAPAWVAPDLPAEMRIASLWVLPGPDGSPSAIEVRFAGPFTPPPGRWRVSVGVGDPSGGWQRLSMVWDGTVSTGGAEQLEGLSVADAGPITASVNPAGSVALGVPAGLLEASTGDLLWAEAVLGEDAEPSVLVRTPWFPVAVLLGSGAPGLLQGSTQGVTVPESPGGVAPSSAPPVVDTGVPSVLELDGGVLRIDPGAAPTVDADGLASAVDLVTLVGTPATVDTPPSGPQLRVDLLAGSVELGVGSVLGPLGPAVGDGAVEGPSSAWLLPSGGGSAPSTAGPIGVDVAGVFDEYGLADPGGALAVSVTRVVTNVDGSVVVAAGVVAERAWMQPGGDAASAVPPVAAAAGATTDEAPVTAIVVGTVLGVLFIAVAMVAAGHLHRSRHPGPDDQWAPPAGSGRGMTATAAASGVVAATVDDLPPYEGAAPFVAPPSSSTFDAPLRTDLPAPPSVPAAPAPSPAAGAGSRPPSGVGDLDDDLDRLTRRLRRLDEEG